MQAGLKDWALQAGVSQTVFLTDAGQTETSGTTFLVDVEQADISGTALLADSEKAEEVGVGGRTGTPTSITRYWVTKQARCYYPPYPQTQSGAQSSGHPHSP